MNETLERKINLQLVSQWLKDILFPVFCLQCQKEGSLLCSDCVPVLTAEGIFLCPVCKRATVQGKVCEECQATSFLGGHGALFLYEEHSLPARLIHECKYNYIEEALFLFEQPLSVFFQSNPKFFEQLDSVVAVPLHPRRFAERGFNQSELLVSLCQKQFSLPAEALLKRMRYTRPQVGLAQTEREKNVENAFTVLPSCHGKNILLIDDVFTTGSTLQECAKALKAAGANQVIAFTLARAV